MRVFTIGQLGNLPRQTLVGRFGKRGAHLWDLANGRDDDPVTTERAPKQLGQETTFPADVYDTREMHAALNELAEELSGRLRLRNLKGRVVTLRGRLKTLDVARI
jgi:DNA polymerase-4